MKNGLQKLIAKMSDYQKSHMTFAQVSMTLQSLTKGLYLGVNPSALLQLTLPK